MLTLLAQIQVVINNRPLTFMYDEPGEEVLRLIICCLDEKLTLNLMDYL